MAEVFELSYTARSGLDRGDIPNLRVEGAATECPVFFQGQFSQPPEAAELLLALSHVVGSRFFTPPAMVARLIRESDPIVTCTAGSIRWEGFSACCSVYARVDMGARALEGALISPGTTNVDFGPHMRDALASARTLDKCALSVGREFVEVTAETRVVEKRVKVPRRWLQGLVEAQHHQVSMKLEFELSALELRRFLQSLPAAASRQEGYVQKAGRGLRLGFRAARGGLRLKGWERLRVLERLLPVAQSLKVYTNDSGASAWQVTTQTAHFTLLLSPEIWRGFSGEGQALFELSEERDPALEDTIIRALAWREAVSVEQLAEDCGCAERELQQGVAALSAQGRVGFELERSGYFRRDLPFSAMDLEALHPRLKSARRLIEKVRFQDGVAWVKSGEVEYRVSWVNGEAACTCPWYVKHQLERGPCKHILAAQWSLKG